MTGRGLKPLERAVLLKMLDVDRPDTETLRASVPYLEGVGGCECGCESFDIQDARFAP